MWTRRPDSRGPSCGEPAAPAAAGVVEGVDRSGWYLLPGNGQTGAIETLLRRTATPEATACVDALFACTPNPGRTRAQQDKAWVAAWLAATVGNARVDQAWRNVDHTAFDPLRRFLRELTSPPGT